MTIISWVYSSIGDMNKNCRREVPPPQSECRTKMEAPELYAPDVRSVKPAAEIQTFRFGKSSRLRC